MKDQHDITMLTILRASEMVTCMQTEKSKRQRQLIIVHTVYGQRGEPCKLAINQLNQLLQASKQIILGKLARAASKYDDRAYCFLGRVVLCHNIHNPTCDELQGGEKQTALLYTTYMFWDTTALHQIVISRRDSKNTIIHYNTIFIFLFCVVVLPTSVPTQKPDGRPVHNIWSVSSVVIATESMKKDVPITSITIYERGK